MKLDKVENQRLFFFINSTDEQLESYNKKEMNINILEEILMFCTEHNLVLFFNELCIEYKELVDKIIIKIEEEIKDINIPYYARKNMDIWYKKFVDTHFK